MEKLIVCQRATNYEGSNSQNKKFLTITYDSNQGKNMWERRAIP